MSCVRACAKVFRWISVVRALGRARVVANEAKLRCERSRRDRLEKGNHKRFTPSAALSQRDPDWFQTDGILTILVSRPVSPRTCLPAFL